MRGTGTALALLALTAGAGSAQATLDEGTFRHIVGGREVATETFSIKETGSGQDAVVIATGRIVYREGPRRELTSQLQVSGPGRRPTAYDILVSGDEEQRIRATSSGSRFSARIVTGDGERVREYLVSQGAVVADAAIAHHHYFVAARVANGSATRVPIIAPLDGRQLFANVSIGPAEEISIAGTTVSARPIRMTIEGGDPRQVWIDDQGRILRVAIPARDFLADRMEIPD